MSIDAIQAIGQALAPNSPLNQADPVAVDPSVQQRFAAALNGSLTPSDALAYYNVQQALSGLTFGGELTAKVVSSFTQSINKLGNLS
ncbi:type III secretion system inner rod subunit SctI [Aeromonas jandaei]|uniref:type III secretion system inner rod subunit SctI n=1 Tax=Aeromonas jandaei TaxID=650 RepID=UPI0011169E49|nr:type III secretion system inner rod subunit SctI [Aeromonas jandaei]TNI02976.1 EscI/YscI/HrpB family type III secretion system inner rod protein [Aeromonas jandaei]